MRNASCEQCKVKMSGSEKKGEREHVRHFLQKACNKEVSGSFALKSCKTTTNKCTKKVCCTFARAKLLFC